MPGIDVYRLAVAVCNAAMHDNVAELDLWRAAGAALALQRYDGCTPLHCVRVVLSCITTHARQAAQRGSYAAVDFLLAQPGIDPQARPAAHTAIANAAGNEHVRRDVPGPAAARRESARLVAQLSALSRMDVAEHEGRRRNGNKDRVDDAIH